MPYTVVDKGSKYFNTATYAGAGTTTQSVTGVGFAPDLIWIKNRTDGYSHVLQDVCRGFGATKNLSSNSANSEGASGATGDNYGHVSTSDSDGFTVTHTINASNDGGTIRKGTHFSGNNYVGWCWDANGTGVSNTSGSITSTVSANTTSGFSIVSYTGNGTNSATVGHGLGVTPAMLIVKNRDVADGWGVWNKGLGSATQQMQLNGSGAVFTDDVFNAVSSTTVTLGTDTWSNTSTKNYIMYCWSEVKGFSKFGSYVGNGSTDGTFIYTGFSPAFVIFKNTTTANRQWYMMDNKRNTFNVANIVLATNQANDESWWGTPNNIDFLSNGIKIRSNSDINNSGDNFIYMTFAQNPFTSSKGIPTTAR